MQKEKPIAQLQGTPCKQTLSHTNNYLICTEIMSNHDDPNDSTQYSTKGCYGDFYQAILNHQCRRSSLDAPGKITKNPPEMKNAQQISSPELCFLSHCYCKATVPLPLSPRPACSLVFNAWLSVSFGNRNTIVTLSRSKADLRLYD